MRAWLGMRPSRADQQAARLAHGAVGEQATARILDQLEREGWHVRHDLKLEHRRFNVDHVLVSPCGTTLVVVDSKHWHRGPGHETRLVNGRVHCGREDRHRQVEALAGYARLVAAAVGLDAAAVRPLLVVHGSPVVGGAGPYFDAPVRGGRVWVLGPELLLSTLVSAPAVRDPRAAAALAVRVDRRLRPYP
ncbi:nuclease-related domain-containing protein, partial [Streptomyces zhihengii]